MTKEAKDMMARRKIAWVYLLHRMFEGNPTKMIRTMGMSGMTVADIQDWEIDYKDAVYKVIQEEDEKGVSLRDRDGVPSIKSIKEKVLKRCNDLITETTDPAKLAVVYKTLSEFEVSDEKQEKSVLDAINETIKPLTPAKKAKTITMLEKMKQQNSGVVTRAQNESVDEDPEDEDLTEDD